MTKLVVYKPPTVVKNKEVKALNSYTAVSASGTSTGATTTLYTCPAGAYAYIIYAHLLFTNAADNAVTCFIRAKGANLLALTCAAATQVYIKDISANWQIGQPQIGDGTLPNTINWQQAVRLSPTETVTLGTNGVYASGEITILEERIVYTV